MQTQEQTQTFIKETLTFKTSDVSYLLPFLETAMLKKAKQFPELECIKFEYNPIFHKFRLTTAGMSSQAETELKLYIPERECKIPKDFRFLLDFKDLKQFISNCDTEFFNIQVKIDKETSSISIDGAIKARDLTDRPCYLQSYDYILVPETQHVGGFPIIKENLLLTNKCLYHTYFKTCLKLERAFEYILANSVGNKSSFQYPAEGFILSFDKKGEENILSLSATDGARLIKYGFDCFIKRNDNPKRKKVFGLSFENSKRLLAFLKHEFGAYISLLLDSEKLTICRACDDRVAILTLELEDPAVADPNDFIFEGDKEEEMQFAIFKKDFKKQEKKLAKDPEDKSFRVFLEQEAGEDKLKITTRNAKTQIKIDTRPVGPDRELKEMIGMNFNHLRDIFKAKAYDIEANFNFEGPGLPVYIDICLSIDKNTKIYLDETIMTLSVD